MRVVRERCVLCVGRRPRVTLCVLCAYAQATWSNGSTRTSEPFRRWLAESAVVLAIPAAGLLAAMRCV